MKKMVFVETNALMIKGMRAIFDEHFKDFSLYVARNRKELISVLSASRYDLLMIDLHADEPDINNTISELRQKYPGLSMLILSSDPEEIFASRYYNLGIKGYLNITTPEVDIVAAIRILLAGQTFLSERFKKHLFTSDHPSITFRQPLDDLSDREQEIAFMLAAGMRQIQISQKLNLSPTTINTHKNNILRKLKFDNVIVLIEFLKKLPAKGSTLRE